MQYVHYWGYIWIKYRPPVSWMVWCHASLLKWSCSLWSTEKAKWSIYTTVEKVRQHEKERTEQNALHSQVQHRASILSINPILSPPPLVAAVLLSVFSSALTTSAGVDPRVPPRLFTPLIFYFPHIFLWSSPPLQQHRAPTQSTAAERSGNTTLSLTLFSRWWSWRVLQAMHSCCMSLCSCKREVKVSTRWLHVCPSSCGLIPTMTFQPSFKFYNNKGKKK